MGAVKNLINMAIGMNERQSKLRKVPGTNYYYDLGTNNTSFLRCASDLRRQGVKNSAFMLTLFDPELAGVDAYQENMSPIMAMKISTECMRNPWYFLREVSHIPQEGGSPVPFRLNRALCAVIWLFLNGIDAYITISRQIGKTVSILSMILWAFLFGTNNSEMMFACIDQTGANDNLRKLRDQRDALPEYLRNEIGYEELESGEVKISKGTNNAQKITCPATKNSIVTKGRANNKDRAMRMGRGSSQPIQYFDEVEFIEYIDEILRAAGPAFVTSSKNARKNGAIYGRLFSSTPGDLDSKAGKDASSVLSKTYTWTEAFYDMDINDVKSSIAHSSYNGIVYVEYPYQVLVDDPDEYWKSQCRVIGNSVAIKREILLKRIHGSSNSPYDPEDIEAIVDLQKPVLSSFFIKKIHKFDLYEKLDKRKVYFVGIDPSKGYGTDSTSIIIFDPQTLKVVGLFNSAHISPTDLKHVLLTLIHKYIPMGILIPERNIAEGLISDIINEPQYMYLKSRLYFDGGDLFKAQEKLTEQGFIKREAELRRQYGVPTTNKTRPEMFRLLEYFVVNHKDSFVAKEIITELSKLVIKNNKIQADVGEHDDNIMALNMCLMVYYHGKNLIQYGFKKGALPENPNQGLDIFEEKYQEIAEELKSQGFHQERDLQKDDDNFYKEISRLQNEANRLNGSTIITTQYGAQLEISPSDVSLPDPNTNVCYTDYSIFDELNDF